MKKSFFCLCIVLLALVLISCGGKKDGDAKVSKEDISSTISKIVEKTESAVVSEIVEKAESVASSVANKIEDVVPSKTFTKKDILDDFGEPTGNFSYDSKAFRGTYKTMMGHSGDASLYISIDNNKKVSFKVVEDGNTRHFVGAGYAYETSKFEIVIREENGNDEIWNRNYLKQDENKLYNTFVSSDYFWPLIRNNAVKLVIKNDDAIYNFNSIDTSELVELHLDEVAFWKDKGSAGGYVFYDCDADNDSGNPDGLKSSECGWRYLEAAPTDVLDSNGEGKGFNRNELNMGNFGTKTGIGEGKNNTEILIKQVSKGLVNNAVKSCVDYEFGGYKDWFVPSRDELDLICEILFNDNDSLRNHGDKYTDNNSHTGYSNYWSSSEVETVYCEYEWFAWNVSFWSRSDTWWQGQEQGYNEDYYFVRPCRAF